MKRSAVKRFELTKAGLWFLGMIVILALAATNTGNNGLYLVLAMMVGILAVSLVLASSNVRRLELALTAPGEMFARQPAELELELQNRGWLPRWLLLFRLTGGAEDAGAASLFAGHLAAGGEQRGFIAVRPERRGRYSFRGLVATSLFPLGFVRRARPYEVACETLVYPEILPSPSPYAVLGGGVGEEPARRPGEGHELFGLRAYRPGDDPRRIHWKQSARLGNLVFQQRESDESRRLLIVLDNAVVAPEAGLGEEDAAGLGEEDAAGLGEEDAARFEHLVSEAATIALDLLGRGYEVGLSTRDGAVPTASGPRQRRRVLEALALVEARPREPTTLRPADGRPHLLLTLEAEGYAERAA